MSKRIPTPFILLVVLAATALICQTQTPAPAQNTPAAPAANSAPAKAGDVDSVEHIVVIGPGAVGDPDVPELARVRASKCPGERPSGIVLGGGKGANRLNLNASPVKLSRGLLR